MYHMGCPKDKECGKEKKNKIGQYQKVSELSTSEKVLSGCSTNETFYSGDITREKGGILLHAENSQEIT